MMRALLLSLLVGCGGATLQTATVAHPTVSFGGGQRTVVTLLDVDRVRDVAAGAGRTYVATDRGVLAFLTGEDAAATRLTTAQGLPSDDVRAVTVDRDGVAWVATPMGLARVREGATVEAAGTAPVGQVNDLLTDTDGVIWACGSAGLAKFAEGEWTGFGERAFCTSLMQGTDEILWAATSTALLQIEGDVIHEHSESRAMPEGEVRAIASAGPGQVMVLLQGPNDARIGHYDGQRWYGYSLEAFTPVVRSIVGYRGQVLLVSDAGTYAMRPAGVAEGARLFPLSRSETRGWRGYRARVTSAEDAARRQAVERRDPPVPSALAVVPANAPTIDAPAWLVERATLEAPLDPTFATTSGDSTFLADANRGVRELMGDGSSRVLSSRDLIAPRGPTIGSDSARDTWLVTANHDLAHFVDGALERVAAPEGFEPHAVATGADGAYVIGVVHTQVEAAPVVADAAATRPAPGRVPPPARTAPVPAAPTVVEGIALRVYRAGPEGFTQVVEQPLPATIPFERVAFLGVAADESYWAGIVIRRENGEGERMRGVAVLRNLATNGIVFHHRASDPAVDGEGSLQMPDEVSAIDTSLDDAVWLASLTGAIKIAQSQAIVFGEARGVRGEIVSDLAVGNGGRVWLAAAEGLGYYEAGRFEFSLPGFPQSVNVISVATDTEGRVYGAGPNGAVIGDGTSWTPLSTANGLPTDSLTEVMVDAQDRLWLLAEDRLLLFDRAQ